MPISSDIKQVEGSFNESGSEGLKKILLFFVFLGPFWRGEEREEEAVVRVGEKPLFANSGQIDHKQEYPGNPSGHGKVCFYLLGF